MIQGRNIRHENVIAIGVIHHENVIGPCVLGDIFAIMHDIRDNYAERLLRTDCAMERQAK